MRTSMGKSSDVVVMTKRSWTFATWTDGVSSEDDLDESIYLMRTSMGKSSNVVVLWMLVERNTDSLV